MKDEMDVRELINQVNDRMDIAIFIREKKRLFDERILGCCTLKWMKGH